MLNVRSLGTVGLDETIDSAPQGFVPNDVYDDDDSSEYVHEEPSYYEAGRMYGMNSVDGMGMMVAPARYLMMCQEPDEKIPESTSRGGVLALLGVRVDESHSKGMGLGF